MSWYKISIPENLIARPVDYVSYTAIGNKNQTKTNHLNVACYRAHMQNLSNFAYDCIPCQTDESLLPCEDFFLWMKYCTAFGFSPSGTIPYIKGKKNCVTIHGKNENKHRIYAGLCCYRWAECLSPMVYEACRLIEKRPDVSFYRIMHYVTGKYVTLMGHAFTNISAASLSLYAYYGNIKSPPRLDHMWGLMPKWFFDRGMNLVEKVSSGIYQQTQVMIQDQITKFGLNLVVKKHTDLLDDKWDELYSITSLDKKIVKECYEKLNKKAA